MFNTPYNRKIKDEMIAIDKAYIKHEKKVSTKGLLNVSADGNKIGGALANIDRSKVDKEFSSLGKDVSVGGPIWALFQKFLRTLKGKGMSGGALPVGVSPAIGRPIGGARTGGMESDSDSDTSYTSAEEAQGLHLQANLNNMSLQNLIEMASMPGWLEGLPPVLRAIVLRRLAGKKDAPRGGARTGGRKASPWIEHVKAFAKEKGINYREALRSPECKASYKKVGSGFFSDGSREKAKAKMEEIRAKTKKALSMVASATPAPATPAPATPVGGARSGGKKFKQVGVNIVSDALADIKHYSPPTSATVPPKVGAKTGGAKSGGAKRKPSKWIEHVKDFASKNGISYREALRSPECKASYRK